MPGHRSVNAAPTLFDRQRLGLCNYRARSAKALIRRHIARRLRVRPSLVRREEQAEEMLSSLDIFFRVFFLAVVASYINCTTAGSLLHDFPPFF